LGQIVLMNTPKTTQVIAQTDPNTLNGVAVNFVEAILIRVTGKFILIVESFA